MYNLKVSIECVKRSSYEWNVIRVTSAEDYDTLRFGTARSFEQAARNAAGPFASEMTKARLAEKVKHEVAPPKADKTINLDPALKTMFKEAGLD